MSLAFIISEGYDKIGRVERGLDLLPYLSLSICKKESNLTQLFDARMQMYVNLYKSQYKCENIIITLNINPSYWN